MFGVGICRWRAALVATGACKGDKHHQGTPEDAADLQFLLRPLKAHNVLQKDNVHFNWDAELN